MQRDVCSQTLHKACNAANEVTVAMSNWRFKKKVSFMEQLLLIIAVIRRHADTHTHTQSMHIYTVSIQFIIARLYSEGITLVKNSNEITLTRWAKRGSASISIQQSRKEYHYHCYSDYAQTDIPPPLSSVLFSSGPIKKTMQDWAYPGVCRLTTP